MCLRFNREQVSILIALGMGLGEEVYLHPDDLAASFFQKTQIAEDQALVLGAYIFALHGGYDFSTAL